jgi:hypothetical protein
MDAVVYSTSDMYTEKQITYMANDLTPLMPFGRKTAIPGDTSGPKQLPPRASEPPAWIPTAALPSHGRPLRQEEPRVMPERGKEPLREVPSRVKNAKGGENVPSSFYAFSLSGWGLLYIPGRPSRLAPTAALPSGRRSVPQGEPR